jgi:hypothetical protein
MGRLRMLQRALGSRRGVAQRPFRLLWDGESILNMANLWADITSRFPNDNTIHETATYGGNYVGGLLLEVADETQAYVASAWTAQTRAVAWSDFQAAIIQTGRNDSGLGTDTTEFRKALDKAVSQALNRMPSVVLCSPTPSANAGLTLWDVADPMPTYLTQFTTVATKYAVPYVNLDTNFKALVTAATYTIAQLMRDTLHPTLTTGATVIGGYLATELRSKAAHTLATPEITGRVVNYIFGQPTAGSWSLVNTTNATGPVDGPLPRIAGIADQGLRATGTGAKLSFPTTTISAGGQVWFTYYTRAATGGVVDFYVDRGTGSEKKLSVNTTYAGLGNFYPHTVLVGDNLSAGAHTIECETTSANIVDILGVTAVGAA